MSADTNQDLVREVHPYGEFVPPHSKFMIIGSFPIGKFTDEKRRHTIAENEIDFSYGGSRNHLWPLLGQAFNTDLNSKKKIKNFLSLKGIALGDVISSCIRKNGGASDGDLKDIVFNLELKSIIEKSEIKHLFFTSSKVKQWFESKIGCDKEVKKTMLISPSGSGLRRLSKEHEQLYENWRTKNKDQSKSSFRKWFYTQIFNEKNFPNID